MENQLYKRKNAELPPQTAGRTASDPIAGGMPSLTEGASRKELPEVMRQKMENAFGADFSNLNIYESEKVAEGGARAVTQGNTIAFAPGEFNPYSPASEALLGHELSHVVSQARGESRGNGLLTDSYLEAKADREGVMAAAGQQVYAGPVTPLSASSPASVAGPMQCKWGRGKKEQPAIQPATPIQPIEDPFPEPLPHMPNSPEWAAMHDASMSGNEEAVDRAYTDIAVQERKRVTEDQHRLINDYIEDSRPYNDFLRSGGDRDREKSELGKRVEDLSSTMQPTRADMKAYRGVSSVALRYILQGSNDKKLKSAVRKDGSIDYKKLMKDQKNLKGLEFTEKAFSSTSASEAFAERWRKGIAAREIDFETMKRIKKRHLKADLADPDSLLNVIAQEQLGGNTDASKMGAEDLHLFEGALKSAHQEEYSELKDAPKIKRLFQGHMFDINLPKGTRAGFIDRMRMKNGEEVNAGQWEVLLDRGTRFRINGMEPLLDENGEPLPDQYRFLMDVVGQEKRKKK